MSHDAAQVEGLGEKGKQNVAQQKMHDVRLVTPKRLVMLSIRDII